MMRSLRPLLAAAFCSVLFAAASSALADTLPAGCGDDAIQYKVKTEKGSALPAAAAGMSQVTVIYILAGDWAGSPVVRVAIDGKWVGAMKGRSYSAFDVAPGSHKICVSRQGGSHADKANVEVGTILAKAGEPIYLLFTLNRQDVDATQGHAADQSLGYSSPNMTAKRHETTDVTALARIDAGDAAVKMSRLPQSVPEPK